MAGKRREPMPQYAVGYTKYLKSNAKLAEYIKDVMTRVGGSKQLWAERIGLSRQGLDERLKKDSFSIDDANSILAAVGLELDVRVTINFKDKKDGQF